MQRGMKPEVSNVYRKIYHLYFDCVKYDKRLIVGRQAERSRSPLLFS